MHDLGRQRVDPFQTEIPDHRRLVCPIVHEIVGGASDEWVDADELRHADVAVEAWWWWGSSAPDGAGALAEGIAGVFVGLELRGTAFDYWAGLVREGEPYLYIEELERHRPAAGSGDQAARDVGGSRVRRAVPPVEPRERGARGAAGRPDRGVASRPRHTGARDLRRRVVRHRATATDRRRGPDARLPPGRRDRRTDRAAGRRCCHHRRSGPSECTSGVCRTCQHRSRCPPMPAGCALPTAVPTA